MGEVEGHGQLAQPRQPEQGRGDQLARDTVHADDEEPLGEAPQEVEHRSDLHFSVFFIILFPEEATRVDNIYHNSWK